MATFDFDHAPERLGTRCVKWDSIGEGELPMWVADMDFEVAPAIRQAVERRAAHPVYGYTFTDDSYYDAVINWFDRRHQWHIDRSWILHTPGVVAAMSCAIKALTLPGQQVVILTPVYNCFFSSIRNNGCEIVSNPLRRIGDTYEMDFDNLERCAADPRAKVMLLCNPHNPAGRVWTPDELTRLGNICLRNGVTVVADEIHCELVYQGFKYTPFASLSDAFLHRSVTCVSPSKAFNIAGLQIANIVAFDNDLRSRIDKAININEVCDVNPFGVAATIAAYNEGEEWLNQLVDYLHGNYEAMAEFCRRELPEFPIARLEGTYLVWMDCSSFGMPSEALEHALLEDARLWLNAGTMYGAEGEGYMRWNIACPRSVMLDGLNRFLNFDRNR